MAEPEWKGPLAKLEETLLVQIHILERVEQKVDALEEQMAALRAAQRESNQVSRMLSDGMHSMIGMLDRFIRGQEGNGRKQ